MKEALAAMIINELTKEKNWCEHYGMWRDEVVMENGDRHFIDGSPQKNNDIFINIRKIQSSDTKKFKNGKLWWLSSSMVHSKCYFVMNKCEIRSEIKAKAKNLLDGGKDYTNWQPYMQMYHAQIMLNKMKRDMEKIAADPLLNQILVVRDPQRWSRGEEE
jgi:hypothetical protein